MTHNRPPVCRPGRCDNDTPSHRWHWAIPLCWECCPNDPPDPIPALLFRLDEPQGDQR